MQQPPEYRQFTRSINGPMTPRFLQAAARHGCILCFHGVRYPHTITAGVVHLLAQQIEECIATAGAIGKVVPLRVILEQHRQGRSTAGMISVTFDDAYASILSLTISNQSEAGMPFTIFVNSGFSDQGRRFWWDRLDELFPRIAPDRWRRLEDAIGLPHAFREGQPREFGPLRPLRQWVLAKHAGRLPPLIDELLVELESDTGFVTEQRAMRFAEIQVLAARAPVELGVHTVSHPVLPLLSDAEIKAEITECRRVIAEHLGEVLPVLAAPYGFLDKRTVRIARESGMLATLSVVNSTLRQAPARDVLPRFVITAGEKPWKLRLKLTGVVERAREFAGRRPAPYPTLPSATT